MFEIMGNHIRKSVDYDVNGYNMHNHNQFMASQNLQT